MVFWGKITIFYARDNTLVVQNIFCGGLESEEHDGEEEDDSRSDLWDGYQFEDGSRSPDSLQVT